MSFLSQLSEVMEKNDSLLCIGLDPDMAKLPKHLNTVDDIFEFNRQIIDKTVDLACAYKPNTAFYEAFGAVGIDQLKKTCDYIKDAGLPLIVDAKRADIGNTNQGYATFIFDYLGADAVTLNPYLGSEALAPFFEYKDRGLLILCRTSNPGSGEFQDLVLNSGEKLYEHVALKVKEEWNQYGNCLLVVGATYPGELAQLRRDLGEEMTFLVPGVGAQGGDVEATVRAGLNGSGKGLVINSGRSIIYAADDEDFAGAARGQAKNLRDEINKYRKEV